MKKINDIVNYLSCGKFIKRKAYKDVYFKEHCGKIFRINLYEQVISIWTPTIEDLLAGDWEIIS